jgi:hypothetical protein
MLFIVATVFIVYNVFGEVNSLRPPNIAVSSCSSSLSVFSEKSTHDRDHGDFVFVGGIFIKLKYEDYYSVKISTNERIFKLFKLITRLCSTNNYTHLGIIIDSN